MSRLIRVVVVVMAMLGAGLVAVLPATAAPIAHASVPSEVPVAQTPSIGAGSTLAIVKLGTRVYVGGQFTEVSNPGAGGTTYARNYLFAFDSVTGQVDTTFVPAVNGIVNVIIPAADGQSIYVGGGFNNVNGVVNRSLTRLNVTDGSRTAGFTAPALNGQIKDMALSGGRLLIGGTFTLAAATTRNGTLSLNAATGALDDYLRIQLAENHNWPRGSAKAPIGVFKLDVSADGTRLVAMGNFRTADGLPRDQVMTILLQPDAAVVDPNWRTTRYEPACALNAFDSYVRDVAYAPDGSYFVVVSTGAGYAGTLCDAAARFNTGDTGQAVQPYWVQATGCDTLLSVAITGTAIYVGGHSKWMNAPNTGCSGNAQQAQIPRPGMAALDPLNGVPISWNPGRNPRGHGAEIMYPTPDGLFVGSDTDYIGNYRYNRAKIAFFPLAGGAVPVVQPDQVLPAPVYQFNGPAGATTVVRRDFTGASAGGAITAPNAGNANFGTIRGGFMIGNKLVYGSSDRFLYYRVWDGTTFGPQTLIDPYNDPLWSTVGSGGDGAPTYRGKLPDFYGQLPTVNGLTFSNGRIYYTLSGQQSLYWRWFAADSLIVGAQQFTVAGAPDMRNVRGLFFSGNTLYAGWSTDAQMRRISLTNNVISGSWTPVTGPGMSGVTWRAGALLLGPVPNVAPVASFTRSCTGLTCTVDASASTDSDGAIAGYAWNFGDGTTATGATASRTYVAAGTYTVTLTVTDDDGATATTTAQVSVASAPTATFTQACTGLSCTFDGSASADIDGTISSFAWTFGDGATASGPNVSHGYGGPGTYPVTLTVTDNSGLTGTASGQVVLAVSAIDFRGVSSVNANLRVATVSVPPAVQAGDGLVLVLSVNSVTAPYGQPTGVPGFVPVGSPQVAGAMVTTVWQKVAAGGDAGLAVSVDLGPTYVKASLTVLAYSGTSAAGPIASLTSAADSAATTAHTTPAGTAAAGSWVLSAWTDKSSATTSFTAPAGLTLRDRQIGTLGGRLCALFADSGGGVGAGAVGSATATTDAASRATLFTIVLAPAA